MEPFIHAIIPALILLGIFPKLDKKYIFFLLPLVWLLDLDLYILETHRFLFHNLIFVFLLAGIIYLIWDKKAFFISLFYGISHLIFDLGYPGVAFFYPLYQKSFFITTKIQRTTEWILDFSFGTLSTEEYAQFAMDEGISTYFSEQVLLIFLLIGIILIIKYRKILLHKVFPKKFKNIHSSKK
ncbi:MAG: metal-dependent hydrolase [Nanoarchaeota archaeon]|nr:metal-dependent hydrolase [Nanoarchaeota archaeon]